MKNIFILLFLCLLAGSAHAQITFQKTYGGGLEGDCYVTTTSDGGYAIAGTYGSSGAGDYDIGVVRTDAQGNVQWVKTYGGILAEAAYDIKQTYDSGFIITGATYSFCTNTNYQALYLVRTDKNGDTLWTRAFSGTYNEIGRSVQQTSDSGFIVVGNYASSGNLYMIRCNSNGDTLWTQIYDAGYGAGVVQNTDKGFTVSGTGYTEADGNEIFICRTDSSGNMLWWKTYGGTNTEGGYDLAKGNDGGFVALGFTASFTYANNTNDYYVVKTDSAGNVEWSKSYEGLAGMQGYSIVATGDGYVLYGNEIFGNDDIYMGLLIKIDNAGNVMWARNYASILVGNAKQAGDGGFALTGYATPVDDFNQGKFYLIKTDANGLSGCSDSAATIRADTAATIAAQEVPEQMAGTTITTGAVVGDTVTNTTVLCIATGVQDITASSLSVTVFPNPAIEETTVTASADFGQIKTIAVYNMLGQQVLTYTNTTASNIKVALLPAGTFLLKATNADGVSGIVKLEKL